MPNALILKNCVHRINQHNTSKLKQLDKIITYIKLAVINFS